MDIERAGVRRTDGPKDSWKEIIRNSFLFSQGSPDLQELILKWMVAVPFEDRAQLTDDDVEDIAKQTAKHISQMSRHGQHVSLGTSEGEEDTYPKGMSQGELFAQKVRDRQVENQTANDTYEDPKVLLSRILDGMFERDLNYLDKGIFTPDGKIHKGRPIEEGLRRDKFSSFLIDFAVLEEGDGYFNWKGLPQAYKQMMGELRPLLKTHAEAPTLTKLYLELHPGLPEEKHQKIEAFFS